MRSACIILQGNVAGLPAEIYSRQTRTQQKNRWTHSFVIPLYVKKMKNVCHGTIFAIGISRISSAPQTLSCGISWFTIFFGTTVWML